MTSDYGTYDAIRRHVVPLIVDEWDDTTEWFSKYEGTAFFISDKHLLTAAHCVKSVAPGKLGILHPGTPTNWIGHQASAVELHPEHDLAIVELKVPVDNGGQTIFSMQPEDVRGSFSYKMWGFPSDAAHDRRSNGVATLFPELVYCEGHVRRRLMGITLDKPKGRDLAELSQVAGSGCSGGPLISSNAIGAWKLAGVYLGERRTDGGPDVGYALCASDFIDWSPALLGRSLYAQG